MFCRRSRYRPEGYPHQYDATVQFYRDVLGLKVLQNHLPAVGFEFGSNQLWIDRVTGLSQAELWLEIVTDDVPAASTRLRDAGVVRCDENPCRKGSRASGFRTRRRSFISFQSLVSTEGERIDAV